MKPTKKPSEPDPFLATMDQIRDVTLMIQQIARRIEALPQFTHVNDSIVMCELINRMRSAVMNLDRVRSNKHRDSYPESRVQARAAARARGIAAACAPAMSALP